MTFEYFVGPMLTLFAVLILANISGVFVRWALSSVPAVKEPLPIVINRKPTAPTPRFGTVRNIREELSDPNGPRFSPKRGFELPQCRGIHWVQIANSYREANSARRINNSSVAIEMLTTGDPLVSRAR